ncbi:ROK family transcriptional regulator [Mycolicibacterium mucogenicum]|uniref:ROK family transcriptional regulator n=1 Tax=Mycolicibacterium mucogenicum TaxID=56689 RepID=A0A4V6PMT2_MYCMU|nr:ROK family transcriptional regulator [Mycolicibacterium mucogenicum]TDK93816.1 ROK family transcriptional regulator [Mycolicibacterium mucogenicum]
MPAPVSTVSAPSGVRSAAHAKRTLSPASGRYPQARRLHIVAPSLRVADAAAGSVFSAARLRGPIARDVIAQATGLSIATVNRQVTALLDAGMLRERADLAVAGAIGRPRIPVEVNHEPFLTLGLHVGARTTAIVATDLFGRTLDVVETPTPRGDQNAALASLAGSAQRYLSRWHRRRPLWVGVASGGVVDSATGHVDHPRLGWVDAPVGPVLAQTLGLPVSLASHVDAMAGAELLLGARRSAAAAESATSLYVYARETVGYALSIGGKVHSPASGPGTISGLPAHSELLGGSGRLESTVSDEAVLAAARKQRIVPAEGPSSTIAAVLRAARSGNTAAVELLAERARVLGGAVALLRDLLNPDDLVVGGQAFSEYPEGLPIVEQAFAERTVLGVRDIRVTTFGNRVQEAGAGVVSLGGLYADPIGAMRRALRAA